MVRWVACLAITALLMLSGCASMQRISLDPLPGEDTALPAAPGDEAPAPVTSYDQTAGPTDPVERDAYAPNRPSVLRRVVWFLPDRIMDALDMVSFGVGIGGGFAVNNHLTYFMHLPTIGWYQSINIVNWNYGRNLSFVLNEEQEFGVAFFYVYRSDFFGGGTAWDNGGLGSGEKEYANFGIIHPGDAIYQERYRDPWAIGVGWGPVLLSPRVEVDIHPLEIADFLAGLFTLGKVDLSGDDFLYR